MGDRGGMGVDSETIPEDDTVGTDDIVGKLAKPKRGGTEKVDGIKDEPRLGWLARYCRYCERNPWTGFLSVFFTVLVMAAVVGALGLASFDSESDKVGVSRTAPIHHIRNLPFRNDDTFSGRRYPSPSAHPPRFIRRIYPTFSYAYASSTRIRTYRRSGSYWRMRSRAAPTPPRLRSKCAIDPSAKSPEPPSYRGRRNPRAEP